MKDNNFDTKLNETELEIVNGGQAINNSQGELLENVPEKPLEERNRGISINTAHVEYETYK